MATPHGRPDAVPYWRLSSFYLFYFGSLGALLPYWSLYLKSLGFSAVQIGELMAVLMATKIIAPNIWGWIADHTGRGMAIVRLGSLLAALAFAGVFWVDQFWSLAVVMLVFSFFWNAALPQYEATTLRHLGTDAHRYGTIRVWGSVGFIAAVAGLGPVLERAGAGVLPAVVLGLFGAIWLASLVAPEVVDRPHTEENESLREVLTRPVVLALALVCFLMQASHGPYYTFFTIYMEGLGWSRGVIGQLWALGVVAEVGIFIWMPRLVARWGLRNLLIASLVLTTLRWIATAFWADDLAVILLAQTLHAASFGLYHAVAIALFHRYFAGRHHGKGQALYSSLSFGAGGALGAYFSGLTWDTLGPEASFLIAAGLSALGIIIAVIWIMPERKPAQP